jgi:hypothetical protein
MLGQLVHICRKHCGPQREKSIQRVCHSIRFTVVLAIIDRANPLFVSGLHKSHTASAVVAYPSSQNARIASSQVSSFLSYSLLRSTIAGTFRAFLTQTRAVWLKVVLANCKLLLSVGQANYFANTTMHEEALPVTVDIIAAKGCDLMIAQLAQDLVTGGIISAPLPGGTIYGGDILLKREAELNGLETRYVG